MIFSNKEQPCLMSGHCSFHSSASMRWVNFKCKNTVADDASIDMFEYFYNNILFMLKIGIVICNIIYLVEQIIKTLNFVFRRKIRFTIFFITHDFLIA